MGSGCLHARSWICPGRSFIADSERDDDQAERLHARARALLDAEASSATDVADGLNRLCATAADELRISGTALTMMASHAAQAVAGASDDYSRGLEETQFSLGEGPGFDAFGTGRPVLIPDLESAFVRWPVYVPAALRSGVRASYSFPLQLGAMRFGVLTFYADTARTMGAPELTHCLIFAEIATELLLEGSAAGTTDPGGRGLQKALQFRNEIYQAQGMVKVALGVNLVEALARMRARAYRLDLDLNDLAVSILDGSIRLQFDED